MASPNKQITSAVRGPMMVQEYIGAIEAGGEWSLIYINGQFSHAKKPRPPTYG
jgi:hypothetical protein